MITPDFLSKLETWSDVTMRDGISELSKVTQPAKTAELLRKLIEDLDKAKNVELYDLRTLIPLKLGKNYQQEGLFWVGSPLTVVKAFHDGRIATGRIDGIVQFWKQGIRGYDELGVLPDQTRARWPCQAIQEMPNGELFVSCSKSLEVHYLYKGFWKTGYFENGNDVGRTHIIPSGRMFRAFGECSLEVRKRDGATFDRIANERTAMRDVTSVCALSEKLAITGRIDGALTVWTEIEDGSWVRSNYSGHAVQIKCINPYLDQQIVVGDEDGDSLSGEETGRWMAAS